MGQTFYSSDITIFAPPVGTIERVCSSLLGRQIGNAYNKGAESVFVECETDVIDGERPVCLFPCLLQFLD
jgi:hypothetical protein